MSMPRPALSLHCLCLLPFVAGSALAADATLPDACAPGSAYPYPKAAQVVAGWKSGSLVVSSAVSTMVLEEFCSEALALATEKTLPAARIDAVSETVLSKYLAKEADDSDRGRALGSFLRSEFGAAGLSRPVYKQTVRLEFSYPHEVDTVRVGSETFAKVPSLLLRPGKIHVEGLNGGKTVCADDLTLVLGKVLRYTCERRTR